MRRLALLLTSLATTISRLMADPAAEWVKMKVQVPRGYQCRKSDRPIVIDGRLDESGWKRADWTADFQDIQGATLPKPKFRTRAKMTWDDQYFYFAAELTEPHVWGTITTRDAVIFQDPDFEIFIDPDGDCQDYYEFEMNALNTVWDLRLVKAYKDGGPALNEWDIPGLKTAVHVRGSLNNPRDKDQGWTVEIAMPWKDLASHTKASSPPKPGDRWRVDFSRVEWQINLSNGRYEKVPKTPEDNWVWSPTGIIDMHRPERWGIVEFAERNAPRRAIRPNADDAARDQLVEIYYLQRQFRSEQKRYAASLDELRSIASKGITLPASTTVRLTGTADNFEASIPSASGGTWRIRQDARLWKE